MGSHQIILILLESCTVNLAGVVENFERAVNSSGLLQLLLQCGLGFVESAKTKCKNEQETFTLEFILDL